MIADILHRETWNRLPTSKRMVPYRKTTQVEIATRRLL
jgi:hypothetical protein